MSSTTTVRRRTNWVFDFEELYYFSGAREPWVGDELTSETSIRTALSYEEEQEITVRFTRLIHTLATHYKYPQRAIVLAMLAFRRYHADSHANGLAPLKEPITSGGHDGPAVSVEDTRLFAGLTTVLAALTVTVKVYDVPVPEPKTMYTHALRALMGDAKPDAALRKTRRHWNAVASKERALAMTLNYDVILTKDEALDSLRGLVRHLLTERIPDLLLERNVAPGQSDRVKSELYAENNRLKGDKLKSTELQDTIIESVVDMVILCHRESDLFLRFYPLEVYYPIVELMLVKNGLPLSADVIRSCSFYEICEKMLSLSEIWGTWHRDHEVPGAHGRACWTSLEWQKVYKEQLQPILNAVYAIFTLEGEQQGQGDANK